MTRSEDFKIEFLKLYFRNHFWKFILRFLANFLANVIIFILWISFLIKIILLLKSLRTTGPDYVFIINKKWGYIFYHTLHMCMFRTTEIDGFQRILHQNGKCTACRLFDLGPVWFAMCKHFVGLYVWPFMFWNRGNDLRLSKDLNYLKRTASSFLEFTTYHENVLHKNLANLL